MSPHGDAAPEGYDFIGTEEDNQCHICYREMDNFKPRKYRIVADGDSYDSKWVDLEKGIGMCPEHGVSYSALSMKPPERGNCHCGKDDCPVCEGEEPDNE